MSGLSPVEMCGNQFGTLIDTALGLCALAEALKAVDLERIEDQQGFLSGLGHLVNAVGGQILEASYHGQRLTEKQAA